jgi:hypothetical protein
MATLTTTRLYNSSLRSLKVPMKDVTRSAYSSSEHLEQMGSAPILLRVIMLPKLYAERPVFVPFLVASLGGTIVQSDARK